jgi:hypothetical protein
VRRFHPDWVIWLCLSDIEPDGFTFDLAREPFDHVVRVSELGIPHTLAWIFRHNVVELCTAVKGPMLARLLAGGEPVVYLDPDIALFAPLDEVVSLLGRHPIVLTPHLIAPERARTGVLDNEIGSLKHGVYNLGFIAVSACHEGRRFAAWWQERLLDFCFEDIPNGLFTDQRWCDLAPALFDNVAILRDPGYNVASWNLANRPISFARDGTILAQGRPLRFFHFTKVNSVGESMLERYADGRHEVFELLRWYRTALKAARPVGLPEDWWAYGRYACGAPIPRPHRLAWRERADVWRVIGDPFAAGPERIRAALRIMEES